MCENTLICNGREYEDVDDYLQKGYIEFELDTFNKFKEELYKYYCQGFYTVKSTFEDNKKCEHRYIFIDSKYDKLLCIPIKIPEENMFNTEKKILEVEYEYEPFNKSNYHTKRDEIVDFDGRIIKKGPHTKSVTIDEINYKIKPEKNYNLKDYLKNKYELFAINDFLPEQRELMKKHDYDGIYEIKLTLTTGEQIHLYYNYYNHNNEYIEIYPMLENNQKRNMYTIPKKYIIDFRVKFYPLSKRLGLNNYYDIDNYKRYTNHIYEELNVGDYILVSTSNLTTDILSSIKEYGNNVKLVYSFEIKNQNSTKTIKETYEFIKFKKQYQYNEDFIVLKAVDLPENNWSKTELTDIISEKWDYILD